MNVYEKKEILLRFKKQKKLCVVDPEQKELEQNIGAAISKLHDGKQKRAMTFRYMEGMSVERAAECMDLSPRQVIRITNQALKEIEL